MIALSLVLSVVFNTAFAVCYKVAVKRRCDLAAVNGFLYMGAAGFLLLFALRDGRIAYHPMALWLGVFAGVCACISTLSFLYHMVEGVLTVSWAVIGLAVGFPILASIYLWHESPSPRQIAGLLLIPVALLLFSVKKEGKK